MRYLSLLLVLLLTACVVDDGYYVADPYAEIAAGQATADRGRSNVQATIAVATLQAGALRNAADATDQAQRVQAAATSAAIGAQVTGGALTATSAAATNTADARRAEATDAAYILHTTRTQAWREHWNKQTEQAAYVTVTAQAIERTQRKERSLQTFWSAVRWLCLALAALAGLAAIHVLHRRRLFAASVLDTRGGTLYFGPNGPDLITTASQTRRLLTVLDDSRRAQHAERAPELPPVPPAPEPPPMLAFLETAANIVGWDAEKIPGWRAMHMSAAGWDDLVKVLKAAGHVTTDTQGTYITDGRTIDDLYDLY